MRSLRHACDPVKVCRAARWRRRLLASATAALVACGSTAHRGSSPSTPVAPAPAPMETPQLGADYLASMAPSLHSGWQQLVSDWQQRLPAEHPLNALDRAATVALAIDRDGQVVAARLERGSGHADFDRAVLRVIDDVGGFTPPPSRLVSDDECVHVRWTFARDLRRVGLSTARVRRIEWTVAEAVAHHLDRGDVSAAARVLAAAVRTASGGEREHLLALVDPVVIAVLRESLVAARSRVQFLGIRAARVGQVMAVAPELRAIVERVPDLTVRIAAIDALSEMGDAAAIAELRAVLQGGLTAEPELVAAAARGLAQLGAGAVVHEVVAGWLGAADDVADLDATTLRAALIAMVGDPTRPVSPIAIGAIRHSDASVRSAACRALASAPADDEAWTAVRIAWSDADSSVRAACVAASMDGDAAGLRNLATLRALQGVLRDRDDAVRAVAVRAVARIASAAATATLVQLRRDKSRAVLMSLAEAWVAIGSAELTAALLDHPATEVRIAAAAALAGGDAAAHARLLSHPGRDPAVRVYALGVAGERGTVEAAANDLDPRVRIAAAARLVALRGRADVLEDWLTALASTAPAGGERIRLAEAWLAAR